MYTGIYGYNGGGVYNSDSELMKARKYIVFPKQKEFLYLRDAVDFVIRGLAEDYKICPREDLMEEKLYYRLNFFYHSDKLIKQKSSKPPFRFNVL